MSEEPKGKSAHRFNYIYSKLVQEPGDLVGLLAYGIYKFEKIDYVARFKERTGAEANPADLEDFHDLSIARVEQYRALAEMQMTTFQRNLLDSVIEELNHDYDEKLKEEILEYRPGWIAPITQSFLGSVVFTIVLGMIVIILLGLRTGIGGIIKQFIDMLAPSLLS